MRGALKYGVPLAAGLATGGYALSQGEDPGSAALAGAAGGLGGAAGLLGARLAGKYMAPYVANSIREGGGPVLSSTLRELEKGSEGGLRQKMAANIEQKLEKASGNQQLIQALGGATQGTPFERGIQKGIAAGLVPAAALTAGLGGVALGAVPGAMGIPGFQQGIDPEGYSSNNTDLARMGVPTMQYM